MGLVKILTAAVIAALTLMSCNNDPSLQKYLVDKQEDDRYLKVDFATSLLQGENAQFTAEEQEILKTIKKVNVIAYPLKNGNEAEYEVEKAKAKAIISNPQYKTLSKMTSNDYSVTLNYLGEEDAIDEVIVFASSDEKGFGVFRLLCDDMRPGQMMQLVNALDRGDIDMSKLDGIGDLFDKM